MNVRWCMLVVVLLSSLLSNAYGQKKFQEDVFTTSQGDLGIAFIGHGTLMMTYAGKVIHVDPVSMYADYAALPKADLILITHEHGDHLDLKAIQAAGKEGVQVVVNPGSAKALPAATVMNNGETKTLAGVRVEAVPAYNLAKQFHPKGNGNGYLITFGDTRVFVAGDTENVPEIKALKNVDIAFLPMNQPYTMTPEQVVDIARAMRPRILYPYHFGGTDTAELVRLLQDEKGIEIRIRDLK